MKKSFTNLAALLSCLFAHEIDARQSFKINKSDDWTISEKAYSTYSDSLVKSLHKDDLLINNNGKLFVPDWKKAPNSYIFDPSQSSNGIYIPVKKAYTMWGEDKLLGGKPIPSGKITADVLWEDVHGLIKSDPAYRLEIIDSGENAKIKVPVNKSKKGNAVIAFRVDGEIYWSWHVWVTDDPSNGSAYKSYPNVKRQKADGTIETIPDEEWGWMDRNLGAVSSSITANDWNRNGGLLYQWGRKDPIPPLVYRGNDFYEVSGSIGRIRHRGAKNFTGAANFDNLRKFVLLSNATVSNNLKLSVKNPLSLIYVNKDDNTGIAYYNNNANLMVNWFGKMPGLNDSQLPELNLWSDNSQGKVTSGYNAEAAAQPYRNKSSYDPCPNGWRVPSALVANLASPTYVDDIRVDFSPFGVRTNMSKNVFESNNYHKIKPTDSGTPSFMTNFKLYPNFGFDLSNAGGLNMGIFPGTGAIVLNAHQGQFTDQHQTTLWTATMARHFDTTPSVGARTLFLIPDKMQPDIPDSGYPDVKGRYWYFPLAGNSTTDAAGCRCIKDPLYVVNEYDFPTEYIVPETEYREGINNPNTYQVVKNTSAFTVEIPVSKAFSVQSQLLNNKEILNSVNFNSLKANILWTTNTGLVNSVSVVNPSPASLGAISSSKIAVTINPNQSGNAVVTLHNGSITNPVYWSWHIWVTDTAVGSYNYTTELPVTSVTNYVNYVPKADNVFQTEFMDRNLGATDVFPVVANPLTPTAAELAKIKASTGLHYQWGRKDPLPIFQYADDRTSHPVYLGNTANGVLTYTTLSAASYNDLAGNYIVPYNTYTNSANANVSAADKISDKVSKVLSYSVKNPLVYMIPSAFAPYNSSNPLYTNGTDWLANEPNLAPERWGRGGKKSPFDPCPEGWRIPDLTGVMISTGQDFGFTPWYKKDKNAATSYSIITDYLGQRVRRSASASYTIGYMFNDSSYKTGNYPNSGSRGFRSVTANQTATGTYNFINYQYPGVWTAALNSNYIGRPVNILFDAASTANRMIAFHDNNDPYFGMSCRCVKIKYDAEGNEEGVIPKLQITSLPASKPSALLSKNDVQAMKEDKILFFPNPVKEELYIKTPDNREGYYYYQIYNMSGQLVKSGKFENGKTNLSSLITGTYLLRINDSKEIVKIIKE
ncbi:T9SS type A sorting domain-containing protein [Chryseobacterium gambrini]|uniref:T9SS type A sorting domain-containing protein n=1 Tax=Chryseobacterium gambrini TaxID=373672 RepID=UPI003D0CA96B